MQQEPTVATGHDRGPVTVDMLQAVCAGTEKLLLRDGMVHEPDLAPIRPGGENNSQIDAQAYFYYAQRLEYLYGRAIGGSMGTDGRGAALSDHPGIVAATSHAPVLVLIDEKRSDTHKNEVLCYPKSFDALQIAKCCDQRIETLIGQRDKIIALGISDDDALLMEKIALEISYQYHLLAWLATSPLTFLPNGWDETERSPIPPPWITALSSTAIMLIWAGFVEANLLRLHALEKLNSVRASGQRPGWMTMFASAAEEHGHQMHEYRRHRDLPSVVAQRMLAADAQQKAIDEAKRQAEQNKGK